MGYPGYKEETVSDGFLLRCAQDKINSLELEIEQVYILLAKALTELEKHNNDYHHKSKETVDEMKRFLGK